MNLEDQQPVKCACGLVAGGVQVHRLSCYRSSIGPFQSKIARKPASSTAPVPPKQASNIGPSIPSPLPRLAARPAIPPTVATVRGCCRTSGVRIGIRPRLRHRPPPRPASFYAHQFPLSCMAWTFLHGGERGARWRLHKAGSRAIAAPARGRDSAPLIRSITHAPDQTHRRPRPIH